VNENSSNISEENFEINRKEKIATFFWHLSLLKIETYELGRNYLEMQKNFHKDIVCNGL